MIHGLGTGRLGDTYQVLPAAGARSHKYFWLVVWVEAESVMELLGSKELSLKGNERLGQNAEHGGSQDDYSPAVFPTLTRCHKRYISNSAKGQEIQWTEAGKGNWAQECQSCMLSQCHSDLHEGHSLGPVSGKDTIFQGDSVSWENSPGFKCQAGRLILWNLNWRQTWNSRFFRLFQFHKIQAATMTRKMVGSATKPGKMLLFWPFFLEGKPGGHAPVGCKIWAWECWRRHFFQEIEPKWYQVGKETDMKKWRETNTGS